ncbi:hypothetical protein UF75_4129 [Desulfosporosinus sp. I2]|uniref:hypothetical protein n=1 Tax=Desulfosporosinus sp. I2 TaxID=1617025 RepID=UPI0005EF3631|nr:hypothetical protein [Desulfosporosinus sp. I2]KJR45500.1 hypothetical protein UF75_4129 [Desulfosporosinus sp. I2]
MIVLKWTEVNRKGQLVAKEKEFKNREVLQKFILKLQGKENFISVDGSSEKIPREQGGADFIYFNHPCD